MYLYRHYIHYVLIPDTGLFFNSLLKCNDCVCELLKVLIIAFLSAVGHWRTASVQKHVGEILQRSHSHCVSIVSNELTLMS